ncbi:MAG: rhomboid family intramembrane serine protease [Candidatus Aenigmarchaeota archaeon]|nr:rhomboid family intramembrane serine protease [Candidatus Aenigmarchaeota archaeon]
MSKGFFFPLGDVTKTNIFPILTISLIIINVIVFVWSLTDFDNIISTYGFVPAQLSLITIFTSMFLHGGIDHIFGNMWYLWIFGDNIEEKYGKLRFLGLYFLSGMAATFTHLITNLGSVIPAIGASGAISGILGSYLALFPRGGVHVRFGYMPAQMPAFVVIGGWFVIQLIFGTVSLVGGVGSGVAFWAHIGGFVFGYVVTKAMKFKRPRW